MGLPKNEIHDNGVDAPDQDWQWDLLAKTIKQNQTAESARGKVGKVLSKKHRKDQIGK